MAHQITTTQTTSRALPIIPQNAPILQIPSDCLTQIFANLNFWQIGPSILVCRQWRHLLEDDGGWESLFRYHFPDDVSNATKNFKKAYHYYSNLAAGVYASCSLDKHYSPVCCVVSISDNEFVSHAWDGTIKVWDLKTKRCTYTFQELEREAGAFAISNKTLFAGCEDGTIKIWDLETKNCTGTLPGHQEMVKAVAISDETLIAGLRDGTITIWDLKSKSCTARIQAHPGEVRDLAISNNQIFSSGYWDCQIKVWDLKTKSCTANFQGNVFMVFDEKLFAGSNSGEGPIKIWDLKTGSCMTTLKGGEDGVHHLAISNGMLFALCQNGTTQVYNLTKGSHMTTLPGAHSIAISNSKLVLGQGSGMIEIRDFTADHDEILEGMAESLEGTEKIRARDAIFPFSNMPKKVKDKVYGRLYELIKSRLTNDYWGCAEHAFHSQYGQGAEDSERAQAIRLYLAERSSQKCPLS